MNKFLISFLTLLSFSKNIYSYNFTSCTTSSNGQSFSKESRDFRYAKRKVLSLCKANSRTSNAECDANILCDNERHYRPMLTCSTSSNGLNFSDESRDTQVAKRSAISQCKASGRTSNAECDANIICNDSNHYKPMLICSTSSNGLSFSDENRVRSVAKKSALRQCKANSRTSNAECDANIFCQSPDEQRHQEYPIEGHVYDDEYVSESLVVDAILEAKPLLRDLKWKIGKERSAMC